MLLKEASSGPKLAEKIAHKILIYTGHNQCKSNLESEALDYA